MSSSLDNADHTSPEVQASPFPFSHVVGLDDAKLALLLAAIDPAIGGVLLRGQKGSAKTTLARGLANVLGPESPFVELPLGATEDRVVGTLDITAALTENDVKLSPGLLAKANNGVLYVDEVNLLADHIVDTLLDAAVSGVNRVERDGLSRTHSARFVLIGSMNPEEGELRPQLLDRFGLCVDIEASKDIEERVTAIARRLRFDSQSSGATLETDVEDTKIRRQVDTTRSVELPVDVLKLCSEIAVKFEVEGLRTDLVLARAASAHAGFTGQSITSIADVKRVAPLVLVHRGRKNIFDSATRSTEQTEQLVDQVIADHIPESSEADHASAQPETSTIDTTPKPPAVDEHPSTSTVDATPKPPSAPVHTPEPPETNPTSEPEPTLDLTTIESPDQPRLPSGADNAGVRQTPPLPDENYAYSTPDETADETAPQHSSTAEDQTLDGGESGISLPPLPPASNRFAPKATPQTTPTENARTIRDLPFDPQTTSPIAVVSTVRNLGARRQNDPEASVQPFDLRETIKEQVRRELLIFVVDTSGSMGAEMRSKAAVGAVRELLTTAYQDRHQVAMVAFQDGTAQLVLSPTSSVEVANLRLTSLTTGGTTPLAEGIHKALSVTKDRRYLDNDCTIILLTDGRATGSHDAYEQALVAAQSIRLAKIRAVVLDCEHTFPRLGLAEELASKMGAYFVNLDDVSPASVSSALAASLNITSS